MRLFIFLSVICVFMFSYAGPVKADDISELKEQLKALLEQSNALNARIEELEVKQESQAKEIKQVPELTETVKKLKEGPAGLLEGTTVGGHLRFFLADRSQGRFKGDQQHNNLSAGLGSHALWLFLSKELSDKLKFETGLDIRVTASATPSLDTGIDRATTGSVDTTKLIYKANLTYLLPEGYEFKAGLFNPMFSEEYAKETWWHELYHQNLGLANLQSWHDTGVELYKNFDFDKMSLPVYLSLLNGNDNSQYTDNNGAKTFLVHIAPELFQTKLTLLGSLGLGRWGTASDADVIRSLVGFNWKYQKFDLLSEYIFSKFDDVITTGSTVRDGTRQGYYLRALYRFNPEWQALVKFSHAELYKTGISTMRSDIFDTTSIALDYFFTPSSTIIGQYQFGNAKRSDGSSKLKFNRFTLGWRTTF